MISAVLFANTPARRFGILPGLLVVCGIAIIGQNGSAADSGDDSPSGAARVVVPGYERFRQTDSFTQQQLGFLLLNELGCQNCHEGAIADFPAPRTSPILTDVGKRVSVDFLREYIRDPHRLKPGTSMPMLPLSESEQSVEAIVHFLKASGSPLPTAPVAGAIQRGEALFHQIGCVACHGPVGRELASADTLPGASSATIDEEEATAAVVENPIGRLMPLGPVARKYTVGSLGAFLQNPQAVRTSGRMPSLNLTPEEASDIASFLLRHVDVEPTLTVAEYHGRWDRLPDFSDMHPEFRGGATDISVTQATRKESFGLRFEGYLQIPESADYRFRLGSDDGSRLSIDGQVLINNDGIHGHTVVEQNLALEAGAHPVLVDYFEASGGESLELSIRPPQGEWKPASTMITASRDLDPSNPQFVPDPRLVDAGRKLFVSGGCANCHHHDGLQTGESQLVRSRPLALLPADGGCLGGTDEKGVPRYSLSDDQREAIQAAIMAIRDPALAETDPAADSPVNSRIDNTLLTFNCFGCHQRSDRGGVHRQLDEFFSGTIPEMGDEGRIPPHLDGAGDKLQQKWLRTVMAEGAGDRHYMHTRMPRFGEAVVGSLVSDLQTADQRTEVAEVSFSEPLHRVKADARFLVGDQSLSCIKCHSFNSHKATGIQALEMTSMTRRLRRDWFHRYLIRPQTYRPQTRMPSAWPGGRSVVRDVLDGDAARQMEAIWEYLADGSGAKVPSGLVATAIELKPVSRPRIYRNFIQGLSPRGIAVGYPEGAHLAYDAEEMTVRYIWHGAFIDAAKHWTGRGQGFQEPLGDHLLPLVAGPPLAKLADDMDRWPEGAAREQGFEFLGYRLDEFGRPEFRYRWNDLTVRDHWRPIEGEVDIAFQRTLRVDGPAAAAKNVYLRLASAEAIEPLGASTFRIDGGIILDVRNATDLRSTGDRFELIVPISAEMAEGVTTITEVIRW